MSTQVHSIINVGTSGIIARIECHLSNSLPGIIIVGFANRAVDEAKERIRGAFANSNLQMPRKRITINLAPADVPKDGSSFDLAIAAAVLLTDEQVKRRFSDQEALMGELGLDGSVRPVRGIIGKILAGRAHGITTFYLPQANIQQAQLVPHVSLIPVSELAGLYQHLCKVTELPVLETGLGIFSDLPPPATPLAGDQFVLDDVIGQSHAKRALLIAAAGGHNLFFNGPPGTGKSLLAKTLPSLLPPLNHEEMLEVTHLHSLASHEYGRIIRERPFRAPHHSATHIAIIGGGQNLRPGEISLSHRGILFFDELPEFSRQTLEALRQPLEDRVISLARARDTAKYPASFILVATANPCPCGYFGTDKTCSCAPGQIQRYRLKVSGPILDRIDLYAEVGTVDHSQLLRSKNTRSEQRQAREQVIAARQRQAERYASATILNCDLTNAEIKRAAALDAAAKTLLDSAARQLQLSARAYMRTIRVARTIADLENSAPILPEHVAEALQYRRQPAAGL